MHDMICSIISWSCWYCTMCSYHIYYTISSDPKVSSPITVSWSVPTLAPDPAPRTCWHRYDNMAAFSPTLSCFEPCQQTLCTKCKVMLATYHKINVSWLNRHVLSHVTWGDVYTMFLCWLTKFNTMYCWSHAGHMLTMCWSHAMSRY